MTKRLLLFILLIGSQARANETLSVKVDGKELISYQAKPMSEPNGGDKFKGSNFFHPIKTPSGFAVTDLQPKDHLHHFGLWWPWKYVATEGRKVLCWELQKGDGIIEAKESKLTKDGFTAKSVYIDRKAPDGPKILINETLNATVSKIIDKPANGYFLDLEIIHEVVGDKPLEVTKHRYSGFCLRGTHAWNNDNSTVLTSEGKDYTKSNFTKAKWVRVEGATENDNTGGVVMMSRPDNHAHPEKLRTWDPKTHNGAIFVNFNPVKDKSLTIQPKKKHIRHYRLFIYDGKISSEQAEKLWKDYSETIPKKSTSLSAFKVTPEWIAKIEKIAPEKPTVPPLRQRKALVFSRMTGFKHWVTPHTAAIIKTLGTKSGAYEVVESDDVKMFEPDTIKQFDIIILNNTCSDGKKRDMFWDVTKNEEKAAALEKSLIDHIANGNGLVAMHGGIAMQNNSAEFSKMLGGSFAFHPAQQEITCTVVDPKHPLLKPFDGKPLVHKDEPYLFNNAYKDKNFRPLLEMDTTNLNCGNKTKIVRSEKRYVAWIKKYGKGRVFYCSPSHNAQSFENPVLLQFILNGIQYAAGDFECDDSPMKIKEK